LSHPGLPGCGKTTLLRCIAGFIARDAGHIRLEGRAPNDKPPHMHNSGMVLPSDAIFPHLSVAECIAHGRRARGVGASDRAARATPALDRVRLVHLAHRFPDALSGGQKLGVGVARVLVIGRTRCCWTNLCRTSTRGCGSRCGRKSG
jgi:ABC-type Fe3+/spermidine/putrescine transport system ATPase subunit